MRPDKMKIKKENKKGMMPLQLVITAIILLILLFVILYTFTDFFGKEKESLQSTITSVTDDYDKDGVYNFYDKCPCDMDVERDSEGKCNGKSPNWCFDQKK